MGTRILELKNERLTLINAMCVSFLAELVFQHFFF